MDLFAKFVFRGAIPGRSLSIAEGLGHGVGEKPCSRRRPGSLLHLLGDS